MMTFNEFAVKRDWHTIHQQRVILLKGSLQSQGIKFSDDGYSGDIIIRNMKNNAATRELLASFGLSVESIETLPSKKDIIVIFNPDMQPVPQPVQQ